MVVYAAGIMPIDNSCDLLPQPRPAPPRDRCATDIPGLTEIRPAGSGASFVPHQERRAHVRFQLMICWLSDGWAVPSAWPRVKLSFRPPRRNNAGA
jgi:hypothetical protein